MEFTPHLPTSVPAALLLLKVKICPPTAHLHIFILLLLLLLPLECCQTPKNNMQERSHKAVSGSNSTFERTKSTKPRATSDEMRILQREREREREKERERERVR
jgi:hypothetical protein